MICLWPSEADIIFSFHIRGIIIDVVGHRSSLFLSPSKEIRFAVKEEMCIKVARLVSVLLQIPRFAV